MKYYKVVTVCYDDVLRSAAGVTNHRISYRVGEWEYPDIGYLFVFDSIAHAIDAFAQTRGLEIWECDVQGIVDDPFPYVGGFNVINGTREELEDWWSVWKRNVHQPDDYPMPAGTILVTGVKLTERVGDI